MNRQPHADFANHLRHLRKEFGLSQQKFANAAELSYRHINFLENSRSKPSREMVLKISTTLKLSLKNTNVLLRAAGFSSHYADTPLDKQTMHFVNAALIRILEQQDPYPAVVMSPIGDLIHANQGVINLFSSFLPIEALGRYKNVYEFFFATDGMNKYVTNWDQLALKLLSLVKQEVFEIDSLNEAYRLLKRLEELSGLDASKIEQNFSADSSPIFEIQFAKDDIALSFFSTYTTFGTPHDVALQELRIECFYPSDEVTERFCQQQF